MRRPPVALLVLAPCLALAPVRAPAQGAADAPPPPPTASEPAPEVPPPATPPRDAPPPTPPAPVSAPATPAPANPPAAPPPARPADAPLGVVASADLGGGGAIASYGVFELELSAGYDVGAGFRPEVSLLLGAAPGSYLGVRLGLHYDLPDLPFYARAAIDAAGSGGWRWVLVGGGIEVRLTDVLSGFAEGDLGIPIHSGAGLPVLVRAGASFRF